MKLVMTPPESPRYSLGLGPGNRNFLTRPARNIIGGEADEVLVSLKAGVTDASPMFVDVAASPLF